MDVIEALLWLIMLILNWRILICIAAAGLCTMLLVSISPDQDWPWLAGTTLVVIGIAIGVIWECRGLSKG